MMTQIHRRIILTRPDTSEAVRAELEKKLLAAFELQQKLSRESPHILRPFGAPVFEDLTFHFDHEPAVPLDFKFFFDRESEGIATEELLAASYALADALRVAHSMSGGGIAHGGLAPGVLLRTKEGTWKVADFRIAPSICETLGIDPYLHLAIGPKKVDKAGITITGAWEILPEEEYERDDRICAFVDPEKYAAVLDHGERVLATFESGSDVIAAGNIIALLAQRIHPFLSDVPEAHRIVEMSRMMASAVAIPLQRNDLLAASENEVRAFAEKLVKMLERQPRNRPRAADIAEILSPTQTLKRDYAGLSRAQDEREAEHWLASIEPLLQNREWLKLESALNAPPSIKTWPDGVTKRVDELRKQLQEFGEAEKRQAQIESDGIAARKWFEQFSVAVENRNWEESRAALQKKPKLTYWPSEIVKAAEPLEKSLLSELKRIDDHAAARKWFAEVTQWTDREDWLAADKRLNEKPLLEYWPEDVTKQLEGIQEKLNDRLGAIHASHQKARNWLEQAKQALRIKAYAQAIETLGERPDLPHWPDGLLDEAGKLIDECADRIGDDAELKLKLRDESVQRAARVFLKSVVDKELAGLLDAGTVQLAIDGDQVSIEEGMDFGTAILVLSLPNAAASRDAQEFRIPISYNLAAKTQAIQDTDGQIRKKIIADLSAKILSRQSQGPTELNAKLKKSLFPQAALAVQIKQPAREAVAKARLDPADKETFDVRLTWDGQRMSWFLVESAELNNRLASRAVEAARETVMAHCLQNAAALAPYSPSLEIEIDAPAIEANPLTSTTPFSARLLLNHPNDGRRFPLQELNGEISTGGRVEMFGSWSPSVSSLDEIIVEEQASRRDAAVETLTAVATKNGAKAKVNVVPKRIKSPTQEITIEIKVKGLPDQTQVGKWNPARFDFDFSSGFQAPASATPPKPHAAPKPVTAAPTVVKKPEKKPPADPEKNKPTVQSPAATNSTKSRKGMFVGGGIAAVVLIGSIIVYSMTGGDKKIDKTEKNEQPPEPPTSLTLKPISLFQELDTEFANAFVQISQRLDGAEPGDVEVNFSTPWHLEGPDLAEHTARLQLGNSPFDARCKLRFDPVARTWGNPTWEFTSEPPLTQISGWMRSNVARRIQALSGEGKRSDAEALHAELAPIFETLKAKGLCESLAALDATIDTDLPRDPPLTATEYPISEVLGTENTRLAKLIQAVVQAGQREELKVAPEFSADPWDVSQPEASTRKALIKLKDYTELQVSCSFVYDESSATYAGTPIWTLLTPMPEQIALARKLIADGEKRIMNLSASGRLNLARTQLERLSEAVTQIRADAAFVELPVLTVGVPAAWVKIKPAGYSPFEPAGTDEQTGYPNQIKCDADGRLMLLVSLPPNDPLWDQFSTKDAQRDWFVLYIDANEWSANREAIGSRTSGSPFNDYVVAESTANEAKVRIPTINQWNIAALTLTSKADANGLNFFDGLFEWCSDPVDGDSNAASHWVTGGCYINAKQNMPPTPGVELIQRINWLKDPLVTQPRVHGDDLVGLRTVMQLYPNLKG